MTLLFFNLFFYPFRSEQFPHLFSSTVIIPRDNLDAPITSQEALIQTKRLTQVLETRYVDDTLIPGIKKLFFFSYIIFIFCYNIFLYCSNSSVSTWCERSCSLSYFRMLSCLFLLFYSISHLLSNLPFSFFLLFNHYRLLLNFWYLARKFECS